MWPDQISFFSFFSLFGLQSLYSNWDGNANQRRFNIHGTLAMDCIHCRKQDKKGNDDICNVVMSLSLLVATLDVTSFCTMNDSVTT